MKKHIKYKPTKSDVQFSLLSFRSIGVILDLDGGPLAGGQRKWGARQKRKDIILQVLNRSQVIIQLFFSLNFSFNIHAKMLSNFKRSL